MFKAKYLASLARITHTTPKIFKANRYARSILLSHGKEIKVKQESKFYQLVCQMIP